ncbi:DUF602-domain-containing protein [Amniculicola lignicola CBS 123094]|uniref:DUF602-domain-containing protein n=1 Tax=Amniculicola lignicola CBS 123094 TaxID=1392246 RepID=A0A6A5X2Y4_9PLEO|nr:DUF602-domain-containing protein [Amniculicola lignicola CBS 123094]
MDGLWGVAGKIPDKGPASANAITYATILGAIRMDLIMNAPKGETEEARATRRDQGVVAGRRMWEDIIKKWRNADLIIEEELVGAMGRLLLVGARPRDWDDVLSLVEQTMNIPRKVSSIGSPSRTEAGFPHLRAPVVPEQFRFDDDHLSPSKEPMRGDEFLPITTQDKEDRFSSRRLMYASPGNNTLSMLQDACLKVVAAKAADAYWDLLTDPSTYNIIPDFENLNMRLRVLRQNRSSNDAVKFITEEFLPREKPRPGTFRIAMSTHAGQILEMMRKELEDTDAKTVSMYADLAKDFPNATGVHYQEALLGVGSMNEKEGQPVINRLVGVEREDAITALNRIQALYHKLLDSDSISEKEKLPFKRMRARLSAFLQRAMRAAVIVSKLDDDDVVGFNAVDEGVEAAFDEKKLVDDRDDRDDTLTKIQKDEFRKDAAASGDWFREPPAMGNDGGSIPTRRELVKEAAKALTTTQLKEVATEQSEYAWSHDPLSSKPLSTPIVSDSSGTLYNKDSIIEFLLAEEGDAKKIDGGKILDGRVKSLKDVVEVKFKCEGVRENASSTGRMERWVCPVTDNELGAGKKSVYLVPCGHAFEASAVEQVAGEPCIECNTAYAANDVVPILSTVPADVARLSLRVKTLREKGLTHGLKKAPGSKKRKKNAEAGAGAENPNSKNTSNAKAKSTNVPTPNGIKNASTAFLTKRVLEEQDARNKRRKMEQNDTQKSLFHSRDAKPSQANSKDYMTRGFSM